LRNFRPLSKQRAQGKPGARCTRGLVCAPELMGIASLNPSYGLGRYAQVMG
jgi:hypothetical protein